MIEHKQLKFNFEKVVKVDSREETKGIKKNDTKAGESSKTIMKNCENLGVYYDMMFNHLSVNVSRNKSFFIFHKREVLSGVGVDSPGNSLKMSLVLIS